MRTRYAAYAVCLDAASVLLTQLWDEDVNPRHWTLPGGGLAWREPPEQGVLRELQEETGLDGRVRSLLGVDTEVLPPWKHHGPLHAIRFIYRVDAAGAPTVMEENGSTIAARWVRFDELVNLPLASLVPKALAMC